jgi:hypothetical protein
MHANYTNFDDVDGSTPAVSGDRYWAHDVIRDFHYTRSLAGLLGKAIMGGDAMLCGGGSITKVDDNTIHIGEVYGVCKTPARVPDDDAGWSIPKTYKDDEIYTVVRAVDKTILLRPGSGSVKLSFKGADGGTRDRAFLGGAYVYFRKDDCAATGDDSPPTSHQLVIASYTGAGTSLAITPVETKFERVFRLIAEESARATGAEQANATALTTHTGNKSNPHGVTAAQVELGNVNNTSDADKPVSTKQQAALDAHTGNKSNPHGVTAAQIGLGNVATQASLDDHTGNTSNPHGVTREQIGLGRDYIFATTIGATTISVNGGISTVGLTLFGSMSPSSNPTKRSHVVKQGDTYTPARGWYNFQGGVSSGPYSGTAVVSLDMGTVISSVTLEYLLY